MAISPKIVILADSGPPVRPFSVSLVAHGQASVRGHPMGRPGWCGRVVGAARRLLPGGGAQARFREIAPTATQLANY